MQPKLQSGLLLLDKPVGISSRKALDMVCQKIGLFEGSHTGTLDPQASGLLLLLFGSGRKLQDLFSGCSKRYQTIVHLGAFSETLDAEGPIHPCPGVVRPEYNEICTALQCFRGEITQTPPAYSAVKIQGRRAYRLARKGEEVRLPPRQVHIYSLDLVQYEYPELHLEIECSAGTYIRSLARDIGERLATQGYVSSLRRIRIGNFQIQDAVSVEKANLSSILELERVLSAYPKVVLPRSFWPKVKSGQKIPVSVELSPTSPTFIWIEDRVVSMAKVETTFISPKKLFVDIDYDV
jgi:tRNA pseudouridine55 synthase